MILNRMLGVVILALFVSGLGQAASTPSATQQASSLLKQYIMSTDDTLKQSAFDKLRLLAQKNPNNRHIISMYSDALLNKGEYIQAIAVLESYNSQHQDALLLLEECLLKDRTGQFQASCYQTAIDRMSEQGIKDSNYLLALYMLDDARFPAEKRAYMKKYGNHNMEMFELSQRQVLNALFPDKNQPDNTPEQTLQDAN